MGVGAKSHDGKVMVLSVQQGSGAAAAGIAVGDQIVTMDGKPLPDFDRLTARIAQHRPGESIEVEVIRGTARQKISVTLGARPDDE
jgi:S1-C subfamily serine protease